MYDIEMSKNAIPVVFNSQWKSLDKGKQRAVDWIEFLLYTVPALVVPSIAQDAEAARATMCLVRFCQHALQYSIKASEVDEMHQDINDWSSYLYKLREAELINNLFFTVNHHYLHHIPDIIRMLGPLRMYSARSMERTIGEYKRKIKSSTNPGADAANILKAHAQSRHEHTVASSKRRKQIVTPIDEGDEDSPEYYGRLTLPTIEP
ncbi:hypothetical protein BCR43DRAFT_500737 [Syncephalastrum racemosum]|uniref:DUF4218 domain-containing protein n=1 Tax=Syncephalastrum racemosum TaxID=13706 RepID=A0A1X2HTC5_SYNRA|nr:hypothetical protein BCR43DRAFT_500737 [Syncephalastrum racemosum]